MGEKKGFFTPEDKTMKKKSLIFLFVILFTAGSFSVFAESKNNNISKYVKKTYFLKNISAKDAIDTLRIYTETYSLKKNILSVEMARKNIGKFEKILKKIDTEKRRISFRIFSVIGSHKKDSSGEKFENRDLRKVITELKDVLSFKSFKLDGTAFLNVIDGSNFNGVTLPSKTGLLFKLMLGKVNLRKNRSDEDIIYFSFSLSHLMDSRTFIKNKGYLVAGVSKLGDNGNALILIINATIQ